MYPIVLVHFPVFSLSNVEEVKARYKTLAKQLHPDAGGSEEAFIRVQEAARQAVEQIEGKTS